MTECILNEDIWHQIVRYISPEELNRLNGCHRVLFEAWMKQRYAELAFTKRDDEMKRLLAHLCNPNVSMHVKRVEIRPWLVQPRSKSTLSLTENIITRFLELLDPHYTKKKAERRLQKRLRKDVTRVGAAFKQMGNVREYKIDWNDTLGYHPELYSAFLTPILKSWSAHLIKLSIKVPPPLLNSLADVRLPKLEVFIFNFSTGELSSKDIDIHHDGFIVFINNLKDSLNSLTFLSTYSSKDLDLSQIFRKMGFFPSLKKIALSIPFDGSHLADPMTFVQFMERHRATLEEIDLFSSRCTARSKPGDPNFINWIQRIASSVVTPFPQLRAIGVALRPLRAPLNILIQIINMHSSTLTSLVLTDRVLTVMELDELLYILGSAEILKPGLTHLQVKVKSLSADLLAALAILLPSLKTLRLECTEISVDHFMLRDSYVRRQATSQFSADLIEHKDAIVGWGLQHLAFGPPDRLWLYQIERSLREHCLPDVRVTSFTP